MTTIARSPSQPLPPDKRPTQHARRRLKHMRPIPPMTREQQMALIEEARAARRAEREAAEAADARALMMARDQEPTYRNGWGDAPAAVMPVKREPGLMFF
jgi:hypothetical protein